MKTSNPRFISYAIFWALSVSYYLFYNLTEFRIFYFPADISVNFPFLVYFISKINNHICVCISCSLTKIDPKKLCRLYIEYYVLFLEKLTKKKVP
jgi:hypothetical protein